MGKDTRSFANQFASYRQLDWYYQWKFRRHLSWIGQDAASLSLFLDFENELKKKPLVSDRITEIIEDVLSWCSGIEHDRHLSNRIQRDRRSEMLQTVIIFFEKSYQLHRAYRGLILEITNAGDDVGKQELTGAGITPQQFRLEAAKVISSLSIQWERWDPYLNNRAEKRLSHLENIANKVSNIHVFNMMCQERAPVVGYEVLSSLMLLSNNFQEFESYYDRLASQLKIWHPGYTELFEKPSRTAQTLAFLEALIGDSLMQKCRRYYQSKNQESGIISFVKQACAKQEWENGLLIGDAVANMIDLCVQTIAQMSVYDTWSAVCSQNIRWEFDKFTEYIPYEMRNLDWTVDDHKTRRYWNWQEASRLELQRVMDVLKPRLYSIFRGLELSEFEVVCLVLPSYVGVQEFTKTVKIPVEWEKDIQFEEGYSRQIGWYDVEVEVARPKYYTEHTFAFDRLDLENATDLLDNRDKIRDVIQTHRNSEH